MSFALKEDFYGDEAAEKYIFRLEVCMGIDLSGLGLSLPIWQQSQFGLARSKDKTFGLDLV